MYDSHKRKLEGKMAGYPIQKSALQRVLSLFLDL